EAVIRDTTSDLLRLSHPDQATTGLLDYYDISNPLRPFKIGPTLAVRGSFENVVLSADGHLIAALVFRPNSQGFNNQGFEVILLQRAGHGLWTPSLIGLTKEAALHFAGRFLFVGMQRPPMTVFSATTTTRTIDLYDFRK